MNQFDVMRLALVYSVQAEIMAMYFDNEVRLREDLALVYTTEDFQEKAEELRVIVSKHNDQL